jgi:spermidine synthase
VAVALNVIVAGASFVLSQRAPIRQATPAKVKAAVAGEASSARWQPHAIYIAIALSGLTALGAEVVWTRLLSLLFGATTYAFSIILAVFLIGLGIGSAIGFKPRSQHGKRPRDSWLGPALARVYDGLRRLDDGAANSLVAC